MTHPTDETLNDYVERELSPAEHVRVATHLETCADCAHLVADIQQIVRDAAALGPAEPPAYVWERLAQSIVDNRQSTIDSLQVPAESQQVPAASPKPRAQSLWPRFAWGLATAAMVVLAFFTGRFLHEREQQRSMQQAAAATARPAGIDPADVRERVLLIAVGDHLERSQMVLVELAHAETSGQLDISAERQLADDLVASNRLYRQTAQQMGQESVATLLDDLERVLVEVARGPSTVSMRQLADIQQRIESQGILFKVKVIGSDIRKPPVS
jgi:anti-sigma factor RsiW